jgi:predicted DNA-binding WGR domain protein
MQRRFEFVGGNSAKFWAIRLAGTAVTVRFGRLGTEGQMQAKTFASAEAAQRHADQVIAQKLAKGYVECAVV